MGSVSSQSQLAAPIVPVAEQKTRVFCVGADGSGKSSFLWRLEKPEAEWEEMEPLSSVMLDFKRIRCDCGGDTMDLVLWGLSGRERTRALFLRQMRMAARDRSAGHPVVVLVFVADLSGLEEAKQIWDASVSMEPLIASVPKVLLATKQDSCDATAAGDIVAHAQSFGEEWRKTPIIPVSSKTGRGIDKALAELARLAKTAKRSEESERTKASEELVPQLPGICKRLQKCWAFRVAELLL